MAPLLGYWKIRGLGQSIRLLLTYRSIEFEEKRYEAGDEGTTEEEKIRVDLVSDELKDFLNGMDSMCYGPQFEALLPQFIKDLPTKLKLFEAFLGDRVWLAGDKMTFVDFVMYELMDQHKVLLPDCLSGYPKLQAFQKRFENLPAIKAYMNSDKFIKGPVYNKMASFKK